MGQKLPKKDKLGIHSACEKLSVELLSLSVEASLKNKFSKVQTLENLRIKIGVLQNLVRTEYELALISEKSYLHISSELIEISKMTNGWINFLNKKEAVRPLF